MSATEYSYLWDGTSDEWALVRLDDGPSAPRYFIVNRVKNRGLIIEDDATYAEVITKMLDHGCRVVTAQELSGK